jgi:hypothetical protein
MEPFRVGRLMDAQGHTPNFERIVDRCDASVIIIDTGQYRMNRVQPPLRGHHRYLISIWRGSISIGDYINPHTDFVRKDGSSTRTANAARERVSERSRIPGKRRSLRSI